MRTAATWTAALALLLASGPGAALAQGAAKAPAAKPPTIPTKTVSEVVITPEPAAQYGAVVGDIKPEVQYDEQEIQTFGVSTVTELMDELAPQLRSDRGRGGEQPVVLLNGRRISGFNEVRDIPTEAILRVDILPEEVALKYGYSANQRVINIVLKPLFRARTVEAAAGGPTEGGQATGQGELNSISIDHDRRINLNLKANASTELLESSRDVKEISAGAPFDPVGNIAPARGASDIADLTALEGRPVTVAGLPATAANGQPLTPGDFLPSANQPNGADVGRFRTLAGSNRAISANAVVSKPIFLDIKATANLTLGATQSATLNGLPGVSLTVPAGDPFAAGFTTPVAVDRSVTAFGPLRQTVNGWTAHLGGGLNRDIGRWRLSLNSAYDHADSISRTDTGVDASGLQARLSAADPTFDPFAPLDPSLLILTPGSQARSLTDSANIHVLASGPSIPLPAGPLYTAIRLGDNASWFGSDSSGRLSGPSPQQLSFSRNDVSAHLNVDVPVASRRSGFLSAIGDLSLNGNFAVDDLSDFGTLTTIGYGLNWAPLTGVTLIVSHTRDRQAPSFQQLGGPVIVTPDVRVFDFVTGQTVLVRQVGGGNPGLLADDREVTKVGLTLKPVEGQDLTVTANYVSSVIHNPIDSFPAVTADLQTAFPDRFVRENGVLTQVDERPVNFAEADRSSLRIGINYSRPIGPQPPPRRPARFAQARPQDGARGGAARGFPGGRGGPPPSGDGGEAGPGPGSGSEGGDQGVVGPRPGGGFAGFRPGGGAGGRGGPGGARGGGGAPGGRLQMAAYYTVYFTDRFLVRTGGPVFDMLNGSPMGSGGGQPRQAVELQAGGILHGIGARVSANWTSGTDVVAPAGDLRFSAIGKMNVRLWADLGRREALAAAHPWVKGLRIQLNVSNLFDTRQRVRDSTGAAPLIYQPDLLDPVGRTATISIRKLFQ